MRWSCRLILAQPVTWAGCAVLTVLLAVMPHDRPGVHAAFEEAANTIRAVVLYGAPIWIAAAVGAITDARNEVATHLAGTSVSRQRVALAWGISAMVSGAVAVFVAVGVGIDLALTPTQPEQEVAAHAAMSPAQVALYLGLTVIAVVALSLGLSFGRGTLPALGLTMCLPLAHSVAYFARELVDFPVAQAILPTTAAGVIARGSPSTPWWIAAVAAISLACCPVYAYERTRARMASPRERRIRAAAVPRRPRRVWGRGRWAMGTAAVVMVVGLIPSVALSLPARVLPVSVIERWRHADPVSVAAAFVAAAQQSNREALRKLSTRSDLSLVKGLPPEMMRAERPATFVLRPGATLNEATVIARLQNTTALDLRLRKIKGAWRVAEVDG